MPLEEHHGQEAARHGDEQAVRSSRDQLPRCSRQADKSTLPTYHGIYRTRESEIDPGALGIAITGIEQRQPENAEVKRQRTDEGMYRPERVCSVISAVRSRSLSSMMPASRSEAYKTSGAKLIRSRMLHKGCRLIPEIIRSMISMQASSAPPP